MKGQQNILSIDAFHYLQLLFHGIEPLIGIHGHRRMRESGRLGSLELSKIVHLLRLRHLMMALLHLNNILL
jgi:hypothetical protein